MSLAHPKRWKIEKAQKLVSFLQDRVGGSGKGIRRMLEANGCRVNGAVERFGSAWVKAGDVVEFLLGAEKAPGHFAVLFENEAMQIINKPAGWVCSRSPVPEYFLVHRLDKETTGALLLAKNAAFRDELMSLFKERRIEKEYLALVDGIPRQTEGVQESHLAKSKIFQGQTIWASRPKGLSAITQWKTLIAGERESLLLCKPQTGRTHQIRVHMAEMGHPILVDRQYATRFHSTLFAARPLLHAWRLHFFFRGEKIEAIAPLPGDLQSDLVRCNMSMHMEMGHLCNLAR